jgi:hypothetical protein
MGQPCTANVECAAVQPAVVNLMHNMIRTPNFRAAKNIRWFLLSSGFLGVAFACSAFADNLSYTIAGNLTYELKLQTGDVSTQNDHFEISSVGCSWQITMVNLNDDSRYVLRYDTTNLVYYGPTNLTNTIPGLVEKIPVPQNKTVTAGNCVWLAYASGCYFRTLTNSQVYSFNSVDTPNGFHGRYTEPCAFELSPNTPYLPTVAKYIKTGVHFITKEGEWEFRKYNPPFQDGFVEVQFAASNFTNIESMSFPLSFEYRGNIPANAVGTNDPFCVLVVRGVATNISVGNAIVEQLPDRLLIQDDRVPEPNAQYWNIGGEIPATNAPAVIEARTKAAQSLASQLAPQQSSPQPVKYVILALLILPPAIFLIVKAVKTRRNQ